jgi:hypothetical protein
MKRETASIAGGSRFAKACTAWCPLQSPGPMALRVMAADPVGSFMKKIDYRHKLGFMSVVPLSFIIYESIIAGYIKPAWALSLGCSLYENHIDKKRRRLYDSGR